MKSISSLFCCLLLAVSAAGCFVPELPDDTVFSCDTAADCAAQDEVCVARAGLRGYCCKATTEVCNGRDDDCDGQKDELAATSCYGGPAGTEGKGLCKAGTPTCGTNGEIACAGEVRPATEACNGQDDDCDGQTDEGFDLQTDIVNCGQCGRVCNSSTQVCASGSCQSRGELNCGDDVDNDADGKTDCADTECANQACGPACLCINGQRGEGLCSDNVDNDADGKTDCADSDCGGRSCGSGCLCKNSAKSELDTACGDTLDNDADGKTDCADTLDCEAKACGAGCVCSGGVGTESTCNDGGDNDKDGNADCADTDCGGKECSAIGGCTCVAGRKSETHCGDQQDNDGDGAADCADYDCAYKDFGNGTRCLGGKRVESNCGDNIDNDGDAARDCADADCSGVLTTPTSGAICAVGVLNTLDEANCTDGVNNDGDRGTDCRTGGQGADPNCTSGTGSCGFGCQILSCNPTTVSVVKKETVCDDDFDNDGDGTKDCGDTDCSASAGNTCRKADGTPGTCQSTKLCL